MRAQEFITERKKRSKKTRGLGGYFFPGYGFYGGDSGEGGGDGGGGESRHVKEDADGQQVLDYIHGTHHEPLTKQLQQAVLSYPRWELRAVPLNSLHIPDQEYDDEEQEPEADPYNRVQAIDPDHAGEYSANFVDRRPIVVDADGWIIDGNHRAWAAAELLNRSTIQAWVPASQLNELGNAPTEYKPNRKRSRSLFHATVDGQWVDVFFDRSEFNGTLHITFAVNGDYDAPEQPTSASKSTVKILSTVLNIVKKQLPEYMAKARPPAISFTSKQDNRTSLYRKYFVPVIQNILGAKWQHEEYPSMGMTVFHWKPVKKSGVTEAFDQPYAIQWAKQNGDWHATADLDDGSELIVLFMSQGDNQWMVEFERDETMEITGEGDAPRVFATVLTAMRQFIARRKPAMLNFSAEKEDDPTGSRARLYDRMIQRYVTDTGYDLTREDLPGGATYTLTKQVQGVAEDAQLPGDFKLMGQNLFLKNLARNLKQRYPDATVKLSSDRVTAYHNEGDDEALTVMGTEVMDSGYIGVGLDDAFTESFQGVLVPTIKQTTEQLLAANPGTKPALFLSTDNWNPDAWTHIATKLGYRLVADDESLDEQDVAEDAENFNGIDISMEVEGDEIMVRATAGGRELGHVLFVEDGEYLMPQDLEVEERFQGQGIAAAMYDYVKSKGYKIRRSGQQTDAGAGFWRKNRGEENVWENFADGRNPQDKGDAKRHGINTKASVSSLRKTAKQGGRKGQLAHWLANMKSGRAKAKKK